MYIWYVCVYEGVDVCVISISEIIKLENLKYLGRLLLPFYRPDTTTNYITSANNYPKQKTRNAKTSTNGHITRLANYNTKTNIDRGNKKVVYLEIFIFIILICLSIEFHLHIYLIIIENSGK